MYCTRYAFLDCSVLNLSVSPMVKFVNCAENQLVWYLIHHQLLGDAHLFTYLQVS